MTTTRDVTVDWTKPIRRKSDKAPARVGFTDFKALNGICVLVAVTLGDYEGTYYGPPDTDEFENVPERVERWLPVNSDLGISEELARQFKGDSGLIHLIFEDGKLVSAEQVAL